MEEQSGWEFGEQRKLAAPHAMPIIRSGARLRIVVRFKRRNGQSSLLARMSEVRAGVLAFAAGQVVAAALGLEGLGHSGHDAHGVGPGVDRTHLRLGVMEQQLAAALALDFVERPVSSRS